MMTLKATLPALKLAAFLVWLLPQATFAQTPADITDLILVTGQSNVRSSQTDYNPTIDATHPRVFAFTTTRETNAYSTGGTWQPADLSTRDATVDHGGTHFDAAGLRTLGERYGSKYLEMTDSFFKVADVSIAAIGDSITQGVVGQESYRVKLDSMLTTAGCSHEWVGSRGTAPLLHEGYSGQSVEQFINTSNPANGRISDIMALNPDVVLLHLGSNDMRRSQSVADTITELDTLLDHIQLFGSTDTTILMANVIPWYGSAFANGIENPNITSDIENLGTEVENLIASRSDLNITLVDVRTGFTPPMMATDLIHPNQAGEKLIADAFLDAYSLYFSCAQSPDQTAPRTFITVPAENENIDGTTTYSGYATDTSGTGIDRVRIAVQESATEQWYSFTDSTFGSISNGGITTTALSNESDTYTDWSIDINLPAGNYEFFALAVDDSGNDVFTGNSIPLWPVSTPFTVSAPPPDTGTEFSLQLQSVSTNLCIEIPGSSNAVGANADSGICITGAANQILNFIPVSNQSDTYTLEFEHSGLCLNVPGSSATNGVSLNQASCNGSAAQQFTLQDEGTRIALFTYAGAGQRVIDSHARTADIIQWRDAGKDNQRWIVLNHTDDDSPTAPSEPDTDNDGIPDSLDAFPQDPNNDSDSDGISGHIDNCPTNANTEQTDSDNDGIGDTCDPTPLPVTQSPVTAPVTPPTNTVAFSAQLQSLRTDLCIEITGASTASGANADSGTCSSASNQIINFTPVVGSTDVYQLQFQHSNLCLTNPGDTTNNGVSLIQTACSNTNTQYFRLLNDGSAIALFINTSNRVIDSHARTADIIQWRDAGKDNQRWIVLDGSIGN